MEPETPDSPAPDPRSDIHALVRAANELSDLLKEEGRVSAFIDAPSVDGNSSLRLAMLDGERVLASLPASAFPSGAVAQLSQIVTAATGLSIIDKLDEVQRAADALAVRFGPQRVILEQFLADHASA